MILVLGAPKASQSGARTWAAGTPNILNVAVSRAKQDLYVIGSHGAWFGVGHARELGASMQRIRVWIAVAASASRESYFCLRLSVKPE